jgi:biopolymer transport protein ExbD
MNPAAGPAVHRSMAMSTAGSREINVTPLIDVLLVLLVIFLLIMPIMLKTEQVALPPRTGEISETAALALKLDADLSMSIDDGPRFPARELAVRLRGQLPRVGAVFVDSVDGVPWGLVVSTVDTVRGVANDVNHNATVAFRLRGE